MPCPTELDPPSLEEMRRLSALSSGVIVKN